MRKFENRRFVHTHVHSDHSKFDGLAKVAKLVMKARQMGFPALALTDHGTVGGWVKLIAECSREKDKNGNQIPYPTIKPLLGCEVYLARDHSLHDNVSQPDGRKGNRHLVLTAKNWKGYQNLCRLSEQSWVNGFYHSPRIDINLLAQHSEGLIVQSACLSSVINSSLLHDKYDQAKQAATIFKDIFGPDFFLEVMYHGIPHEAAIIPDILKLGSQLDIPIIATNDCHYIEKPQAKSQEILMCMSTSKCVLDPKHIQFPYDEFYLKSAEEMGKIFGTHPYLLDNTYALSERIDAKDIFTNMKSGMRLPDYKIPVEFKTPQDYLEHLAREGMKKLGWDTSPEHVACLEKEIRDIRIAKDNNNYDFATYFRIVWDYVNFARRSGILTGCGRGSGYASVLLRTLGITYGPDPIRYGLLWERFLGFDEKQFINDADFGFKLFGTEELSITETLDMVQEQIEEQAELETEPEFDDEFQDA